MTTLTPLLLAALLDADARLDVRNREDGLVEVRLCLRGAGQQARYELTGSSGSARSSQSGTLTLTPQPGCPVTQLHHRQSDSRYRLRWWLDGVEQEAIERQPR